MPTNYKIVTITFQMNTFFDPAWRKFESESAESDFTITHLDEREEIYGMEYFRIAEKGTHLIRRGGDVMAVDESWEHGTVLPLREPQHINTFSCQLFYTHAVRKRILYFHSSLIDYQGRGLMFLGPSGIGKTTQAELWNQYRDALIINGDVVFVQEAGDTFFGWGSPWHGSSPYCENRSAPLSALIVLKQSAENSIRELTGFEKVTAVSESVYYPRWLDEGMELCLDVLDHLLTGLPVYELSCRPDEQAVRLAEKTVFGK